MEILGNRIPGLLARAIVNRGTPMGGIKNGTSTIETYQYSGKSYRVAITRNAGGKRRAIVSPEGEE